ncbi:hypothetical protein UFOVP204_133 [uncultured Caudovirales phage]|uniref:Uncharacterized protein n=1 Tax=uncultured Caudovirales phage TaxID=2100421 RepID=A0A6J7WJT4_9CAUD|nr:hypothetical protein UFOVP204_133 [uncultured Caudovirales phage]
MENTQLDPRLQKLVDAGESGTDILHGELKNLMLEAEQQLELAQEAEDDSGEAMDSMERKYWEGQLDALGEIYALTYQLAFSISDRRKTRRHGYIGRDKEIKSYKIQLEVDELWLKAIKDFTDVSYVEDNEILNWINVEVID